MKIALILTVLILNINIAIAEIYKWTDKNGKVHFSDKPPLEHQAEQLDEEKLNQQITSVSTIKVEFKPIKLPVYYKPETVIMYSAEWCKSCVKAKNYFQNNDIDFIEKNINKSTQAREEFNKYGDGRIPLILVGDYQMIGFGSKRFKKLMDKVNPNK